MLVYNMFVCVGRERVSQNVDSVRLDCGASFPAVLTTNSRERVEESIPTRGNSGVSRGNRTHHSSSKDARGYLYYQNNTTSAVFCTYNGGDHERNTSYYPFSMKILPPPVLYTL